MVAGAHRDAVLIQERSHIVPMNRLQVEGDDATPLRCRWSIHREPADAAEYVERIGDQGLFMGLDALHADAAQIVHSHAQSNSLADRGRSRLELRCNPAPGLFRSVTSSIMP